MAGKKEIVAEGVGINEWVDSRTATILDYANTLVYVKNTNLSGTDYGLKYSVLLTPDLEADTVDWYVRISGAILTAGSDIPLPLNHDAWDAVKVQVRNAVDGEFCQYKVYIVRKNR